MKKDNIKVFAERGEDGIYILRFGAEGIFSVFSEGETLESGGEELKISVPFPQERRLFAVTQEGNAKKIYISEKHIPMHGTPNFRDLGGMINKSGKQIKWGSFFRSGMLSRLTDTDLEYFKTLGIKTVIDFRSDDEVLQEPDKFPDGHSVNYVRTPIGNPAEFEKLVEDFEKKQNAQHAVRSVMLRGAEAFVEVLADFKPVIEAMRKGEPFLFHCSAGKDRTGLSAALILSILDVDREIILEDYLLSNKYTIPYFTKYVSLITDLGIPKDVALAASGVNREFLETTFKKIDEKYVNFDNMFMKVFNVGSEEKKKFIEKYTI